MPNQTRIVAPGPSDRTVRIGNGQILHASADWELLPPGDPGLTRRVKAAGPTWTVQEKKGRKAFSRGVWAPADRIAAVRAELEAERSTDAYAKRRAADVARRDRRQTEYVEDFRGAVLAFLDFSPRYADLAERLADTVTQHATPVGSGTVARTQRIPIERRAESAVIAWLRHGTTAYDNMKIPRVKGKRREVRRMLAEQSRRLLELRGVSPDEDRFVDGIGSALNIRSRKTNAIDRILCSLTDGHGLAFTPDGRWTGDTSAAETPVYIVQHADRQEDLTAEQFEVRYRKKSHIQPAPDHP